MWFQQPFFCCVPIRSHNCRSSLVKKTTENNASSEKLLYGTPLKSPNKILGAKERKGTFYTNVRATVPIGMNILVVD